jgi:hypothetical protein
LDCEDLNWAEYRKIIVHRQVLESRMQKKALDPRKSSAAFVQAHLEKHTVREAPISDPQKIVNLFLAAGLVVNMVVVILVFSTSHATAIPQAALPDEGMSIGDAMQKIQVLEASVQNMRNCVEFHKNAYYKLELEHETMKAAVSRITAAENSKGTLVNYPSAPVPSNDPTTQTQAAPKTTPDTTIQTSETSVVTQQFATPQARQ